MKNFKLIKLLALFVVLITSIPQMWGGTGYTLDYPYIYYNNDAGWSDAQVIVGRDWTNWNRSDVYPMTEVTGTKLYFREVACKWDDNYNEICILTGASAWGGEDNNIRTRWGYATAHADNDKLNYRMDYHRTYLWDGKSADPFIVVNSSNTITGYTNLNYSQTVKKYTCVNGTSYSAASVNSGTVTIEPYKMTAHGTASKTSNKGTISTAGATEVSKDAAYTGEVELKASANDGYVFMGWFNAASGGEAVETSTTYKYNAPRATKTVYARFAPKFTVGKRLYLNLDSFTSWKNDGARFAACFGNATTQQWVNCTLLSGNTYYVDVPSGSWGYVIFCRMGSSATNAWSNRLNQAPDLMAYGTYNCAKITGWDAGSWCRYSQNPVIIRSHNDWDPENADVMSISGNTCTKSLEFNAKSTYQVKILDGTTEYGLNEHVVTSSISNYTIKSGEYQLRVATAGAGNYSFTYDKSNHQLSIAYPTVNHPSTDYCYVIDYSWGTPKLHIWGSSSGAAATSSVTTGPTLYNKVEIQGTNYFYIAPGDYANFLVSNNGDASNRTGDLNSSDGYGKYRWADVSTWKWSNWSFTVTLTEQVTTTSAPSDPTVQFNGTALSDVTAPVCGFYTFGGYYPQAGGGENQVITSAGKWNASVSGYTDGSKKWIHNGGTGELFAKWTQSIALNQNGATTDGSTSLDATYNAVLDASGITNPSKDYYTFKGWTNGTGGSGDVVIDENKDVKTVASWTDGSDKWIHNAASELYAKWDEDTHMVTLANDGFGHVEISSSTVTSVSGIGVETASSTITAVPTPGYQFVNWTGDFGDGVTIATGSTDDASITINATADGKTIRANFEPIVYDITLDDNGEYGGNGSAKITFFTTSFTKPFSAPTRAGYHVDGYYRVYTAATDDWIDRVAEADGSLNASMTYTDASKHWTYVGNRTLYTRWIANSITINLDDNKGGDATGTAGSTTRTVTMDDNDYSPITLPTRTGYDFAGYYASDGSTLVFNSDGDPVKSTGYINGSSNWINASTVTLYAHWTPVALTFYGTTDHSWSTASNWSPACVPTSGHDVTINNDVTVSGAAAAKSIAFGVSGTLTIESSGALEVAGTITNTDENKIEISSANSGQGALIFDNSAGTTKATVDMFTTATKQEGGYVFQMCAVPMTMVEVSKSFAGKGIYTYAWVEGTGWERRNYYYAVFADEAVALTQTGENSFYYFFRGTLADTEDRSYTLSKTGTDPEAAGMNLFGNSWTAPIKISEMKITGDAESTVYIYEDGDWKGYGTSESDEVVPAMQAYLVIATGSGKLDIDYDDAVRGVPAAQRNEKLRAPKRNTSAGIPQMKLFVSDNERQTDLRLFENEQFTNEFDNGWEARYIEGDGRSGQLYAQTDDKMTVVASPDLEGQVVGFVPGMATNYTISFAGDGMGYYLNDLDEQESTLIEEGNTYVFTPNESTNATRFVISKTPIHKTTTGNDAIYDGSKARKQMIDGILYIIRDGRIYDATGALVK